MWPNGFVYKSATPPKTYAIMEFNIEDVVSANSVSILSGLREAGLAKGKDSLQIKETEEIGDGNLNIVYRVVLANPASSPSTPQDEGKECSVIVKYAPPYIKVPIYPFPKPPIPPPPSRPIQMLYCSFFL